MTVQAVAFIAISKVAALVPARAPRVLLVALQAPSMLPAPACRIILAAFGVGFAHLAVLFKGSLRVHCRSPIQPPCVDIVGPARAGRCSDFPKSLSRVPSNSL